MKYYALLAAGLVSLSLAAQASPSVHVTTPTNNQQVGMPFNLVANATGTYTIVAWHVYIDSVDSYQAGQTNSINPTFSVPAGTHQVVTRAWDSTGAYGDVWETITVTGGGGGGGNGLPQPPPGATVINHIEDRNGWNSCHDPGCAGGSGSGSYWMAQHQGNPSRDGSSTEFFNSGVWANALWWNKVGANNSARNFEWDFWFQLDNASQSAGQALEFDAFQFVGGYNYMIGTQCNYGAGVWDTWDEASGHWMHTTISCPRFSPNTWHHVQWYMTTNTSNHSYKYVQLIVDGHSYNVNITRYAKYLAWGDNIGVQWQLDVNASGQGYHEWIDQATLTYW